MSRNVISALIYLACSNACDGQVLANSESKSPAVFAIGVYFSSMLLALSRNSPTSSAFQKRVRTLMKTNVRRKLPSPPGRRFYAKRKFANRSSLVFCPPRMRPSCSLVNKESFIHADVIFFPAIKADCYRPSARKINSIPHSRRRYLSPVPITLLYSSDKYSSNSSFARTEIAYT